MTHIGGFGATPSEEERPNQPEQCAYFTDEVKIRIGKVSAGTRVTFQDNSKYVNEFKILNNIGRGSFSKVKKVQRISSDEGDGRNSARKSVMKQGTGSGFFSQDMFAMKMMHKPVLI